MKKIRSIVLSVLVISTIFVLNISNVSGQTFEVKQQTSHPITDKESKLSIPVIPMTVITNGRQAISSYLSFLIQNIEIKYSGRSITIETPLSRHIGIDELRSLGYTHNGDFEELTESIYNCLLSCPVVKTPEGYWDVNVEVIMKDQDYRILFSGWGFLNIIENPDGTLICQTFKPWVSLNKNISVLIPQNTIYAKWIGNWGEKEQNFPIERIDENYIINIPLSVIDHGILVFADSIGDAYGWDLASGGYIIGKRIRAILGETQSWDIRNLKDPVNIDAGFSQFYKSDGQIYGRFPLINLTTSNNRYELINFSVPVWGMKNGLRPAKMFITPIHVNGFSNDISIGVEGELNWINDGIRQGFLLDTKAGIYHIRSDFPYLRDWDSDPKPKG